MSTLYSPYNEKKKIWNGPKQLPFYDFNCSVGKIIHHNLRNYPRNIFEICASDGKYITNYEALTWSARLAGHFKELGLTHEDVVGIVACNSLHAISVAYACLFHCTPFHALNPTFDDSALAHLFAVTKPKLIFCDGQDYEKIKAAAMDFNTKIYTLTDPIPGVPKVEDLLQAKEKEFFNGPQELISGGAQTMAILCSSGTTGMPKAVTVSNYRLIFDLNVADSTDIIYCASGLDWFSGLMMSVLPGTHGCARILSHKSFLPEHFVEVVKKFKVTYVFLAPYQAARLVAYREANSDNLSSVRFVNVGGAGAGASTLQRLTDIFKNAYLSYNYGFTEFGGVAASLGKTFDSSVGRLLPGVRMRVVSKEGVNMEPNKVGELYVHSGHTWHGYYGNPEATEGMQDSAGWFHSGDLGFFDEDHFLHVIDRKKDVLKYQGMHFWPSEIEMVIAELPEVVDVCVVGVRDELNGDAAGALVVKNKWGYLREEDVQRHVAQRLPEKHKHLHAGVCFVDKLPHNHNGKALKRQSKALFYECYKKHPK